MDYLSVLNDLANSRAAGGVLTTPGGSICVARNHERRAESSVFMKTLQRPFLLIHAPLSKKEVRDQQEAIGQEIPQAYQEFLDQSNGGSFFQNAFNFYGKAKLQGDDPLNIGPISLVNSNTFGRPKNLSRDLFVVGYYEGISTTYSIALDGTGRCFVVQGKNNPDGEPLFSWPSLAEMFFCETKRFAAAFDEFGVLKNDQLTFFPPCFAMQESRERLLIASEAKAVGLY